MIRLVELSEWEPNNSADLGYSWGPSSRSSSMSIPISIVYRATHTRYGGSVPQCNEENLINETCVSTASRLELGLQLNSIYSTSLTTDTVNLQYGYSTDSTIDGVPPTGREISVSLGKYFSGIGFINLLRDYQWVNKSSLLGPFLDEEKKQYVQLLMLAQSQAFQREFLYDPDISIQLLFGTTLPPENVAPGELSSAGVNAVAVAVGVVVAVVVAVAGISLFAKVIFPFVAW